ncbi:MAG: type 2 isopentenyl-diphosphate Delta-isomerase [Ktedonobacterales bacterium]|nr:type 2 isopentenyl-diphosphate Delta-isomerase [Ktedonobacterales bacterium]
MSEEVKQRKAEHVSISLANDIAAPQAASWADIALIHRALPEVDVEEIDASVMFLGKRLRHPIFVSSLTGGHPDVAAINEQLAAVAEEYGLAMGVGSQRAAIVSPELARTYAVVRAKAPSAFLIANVGAPQLIAQQRHPAFTAAEAARAIEMIGADALAVHLNFLQEAAQPEGDRRARGCVAALERLVGTVGVPVIAKETGAGISYEQARALKAAGVAAIDVGGAGGSSMAALESYRAASRGDARTADIGRLFRAWGIVTPIAVVEAGQGAPGLPLIATGGVRSGLDAARALALGATLVGMGFPFLKAASEGERELHDFLERFLAELRVAMQLAGAASVAALQRVPVVVGGAAREWLDLRGFDDALRSLARR